VEKQLPQETIHGLAEDSVAEDLAPHNSTQHISAQDEFHTDPASPDNSAGYIKIYLIFFPNPLNLLFINLINVISYFLI